MNTTQELLARWKDAKGYPSDSAAARALKVRPSAVANWQAGLSHANPVAACRMAEDLKLDPCAILASIEADRTHDADTRRVWQRFGKGAFMALLAIASLGGTPRSHAGEIYGERNAPLCERPPRLTKRPQKRSQGGQRTMAPS